MLKKIALKKLLHGLMAIGVFALVAFAALVWLATSHIAATADDMGLGKDVVADVLPPPLYVLEAQLVVLQLHDAVPGETESLIRQLESLKKAYDQRVDHWQNSTDLNPNVKKALLGTQRQVADQFWGLVLGDLVGAVRQGDSARSALLVKEVSLLYQKQRAAVNDTVELASAFADDRQNAFFLSSKKTKFAALSISLAGIVLAILAIRLVVNEIMRRLGGEPLDMLEATQRIAAGDLSVPLAVTTNNGSSLLAGIEQMRQGLHASISQTRSAAEQMSEAARRLATSSHTVSVSSVQQGEAAAAMAAAVEQVTVSIAHVSDNASSAHDLADEMGKLSSQGKALVVQTVEEINKVAISVDHSSGLIQSLGEQSQHISGIVSVIRDIASQTNLLALNAAIEAARAGEQGRGFAVVADEVRKLSERTSSSTQEISDMIESIQSDTQNTVHSMSLERTQVGEGVQMAAQAGNSMGSLHSSSIRVVNAVEDISSALREQSVACTDIARNVENIARMTEQNSAAIDEVVLSADELENLSGMLRTSTSRFKV